MEVLIVSTGRVGFGKFAKKDLRKRYLCGGRRVK